VFWQSGLDDIRKLLSAPWARKVGWRARFFVFFQRID
jgi:hypothetical protein